MGLLRGMARTAVVAGTATAVSNRVSRRQANRWAQEPQQYAPQQQYAAPPPPPADYYAQQAAPPPAAISQADTIEQLKQLGALHEQGVLTDQEFAVQKSKLLNP